jgi:hypothetical protein
LAVAVPADASATMISWSGVVCCASESSNRRKESGRPMVGMMAETEWFIEH